MPAARTGKCDHGTFARDPTFDRSQHNDNFCKVHSCPDQNQRERIVGSDSQQIPAAQALTTRPSRNESGKPSRAEAVNRIAIARVTRLKRVRP